MNKKEKIKELMDMFAKIKAEGMEIFSRGDIYGSLYKGLEAIDGIDRNYQENLDKIKGNDYSEKITHLQDFSFKECCTVLTALLRYERFVEGVFYGAVRSGDVLKILSHAYTLL